MFVVLPKQVRATNEIVKYQTLRCLFFCCCFFKKLTVGVFWTMFLIYEYNLVLFLWRHIVRWGRFKISELNLGHYLLFYHSKLCQCLVQLRVNSLDPFMKLRVENIHPSVQLLLSALQLLQQVLCVTTKLLSRASTAGKMLPLHVGLKFLSTEVECRSIELFDKGYCTRLKEEWGEGRGMREGKLTTT